MLKAWGRASTLPAEIERLTQAIAALGAVNLAALDELTQATERKIYLDAQAQDLAEAMATLESAIRQIDRIAAVAAADLRPRQRQFRQAVPDSVRRRPGRLLLTGEKSSMPACRSSRSLRKAQHVDTPAFREKSLTAIALVFALFQINPAPFCLLDEVDAPLDDPNTDRFCALVRTMSDATQFLFISHNKITMEMANQLIGITMPDPGVSRVVAVDIAEALELAETAP